MQSKSFAWRFAAVRIPIAIAGNLVVCWSEWTFYNEISELPPGTGIRWMGADASIGLVACLLTLILAVPLCLIGGFLGILRRNWFSVSLAMIGLVLACAPFPLSSWLTGKIISA